MRTLEEPPTILVVDDDETVIESLRTQLRRGLGGAALIDAASSGDEAIALAEEYVEDGVHVPVIICDEIMPGMRGHAALKALHARLPDARTILLTGQADLSSVTEAVNHASLYRYIAKPWERVDLLLTVRAALDAWTQDRDRDERLQIFHSFVPEEFLRMLGLDDPRQTSLGLSSESELTVLFADIRGFTAISERLGSAGTFRFLNTCFRTLVPILTEHGGVVDKYIGDALLALFHDPESAIAAASAMVAAAPGIDTGVAGQPGGIRLGIGVNTGPLILGTVGIPERLQTTVIGDVVNTAARVESLTKELRTAVLLSESSAARTDRETRYVGRFELRGKGAAVPLYQLVESLSPDQRDRVRAGKADFEAVVRGMSERAPAESAHQLHAYVQRFPEDELAQALFHRIRSAPLRVK